MSPTDRPLGLTALSVFFALGTIPSTASALALAFPGAWSEAMWRLKPDARTVAYRYFREPIVHLFLECPEGSLINIAYRDTVFTDDPTAMLGLKVCEGCQATEWSKGGRTPRHRQRETDDEASAR